MAGLARCIITGGPIPGLAAHAARSKRLRHVVRELENNIVRSSSTSPNVKRDTKFTSEEYEYHLSVCFAPGTLHVHDELSSTAPSFHPQTAETADSPPGSSVDDEYLEVTVLDTISASDLELTAIDVVSSTVDYTAADFVFGSGTQQSSYIALDNVGITTVQLSPVPVSPFLRGLGLEVLNTGTTSIGSAVPLPFQKPPSSLRLETFPLVDIPPSSVKNSEFSPLHGGSGFLLVSPSL